MSPQTLLHRQINPGFLQDGRVTSQAFKPTPKDKNKLSVYDGDQMSAQRAWEHYTVTQQLASKGVQSVTVGECTELDLPAEPDPTPFPAHAVILFDGCISNSQIEKKAKKLRHLAAIRDWQYYAEPDE